MRLSFLTIAVVACSGQLLFASPSKSQVFENTKVTIVSKKSTLKNVISDIEKQTPFRFAYIEAELDTARRVDFYMVDEYLPACLFKILEGTDINYHLVDNSVIVLKKMVPPPALPEKKESPKTIPLPDLIVIGTVKDDRNNPLAGVTVTERGTTNATQTDSKGNYKLKVRNTKSTLVFSYIGFSDQLAIIGDKKEVSITLKSTARALDSVVVIGYGTAKRKDVTGAIASIKAAELEGQQLNNIQQALQGRVAGLQMTTGDATPGSSPSIRIRGVGSLGTSSEPLFVVDGYPSNDDLTTINPNDIESIDVLKDASATAIYGSRGANGVILITTKKGKSGRFNVDVDVYTGSSALRKKLDLMNAVEYATYRNQISTGAPFATEDRLKYYSTHSTDWQDALFKSAQVTSANISMSGGDDKTKYLISAGYLKQEGIVLNTGFERGTFRINFDKTLNKKLKFNLITTLAKTFNNRTLVNTAGGTSGGVVLNMLRMNPCSPIYDSLGNLILKNYNVADVGNATGIDVVGNPVAYALKNIDDNNVLRGQLNTSLEYEIIPGLKAKVLLGGQYSSAWRNAYTPSDLYEQQFIGGAATKSTTLRYDWINEDYLTYTKNFNSKTAINALLGTSFQMFKVDQASANATQFFTNEFTYNSLGAGTSQTNTSGASKNQLQSFYGRVNVKLIGKLNITASLRADGSSKFGENHKYGYFPSTAVAYNLEEERFIKKLKIVNSFKVRAGYGITGNQEINPYLSPFIFQLASTGPTGDASGSSGKSTFGGSYNQVALSANTPANPSLQWEQTGSFNTGTDISILNNKISLTADYYIKTTNKLLWKVPVPVTSGFTGVQANVGSIENKGFELALNTRQLDGNKYKWNTTITFAQNKNNVLSLGTQSTFPYGQQLGLQAAGGLLTYPNIILIQPGLPIGTFLGFQADGIWQTQDEIDKSNFTTEYKKLQSPGRVKYVDKNGDGIINADDREVIGNANPKFTYGFINNFSYKGFDLTVFFQGQQGNRVLNMNKGYTLLNFSSNKLRDVENRWTGPGTSNTLTKGGQLGEGSRLLDQTILEDASYLRLKSITLNYNVPPKTGFIQRAGIKSLRVYVTGTNLLTVTKYSGYDPEVGSYNNNPFAQGIDYGAYPTTKSIIVGVKIGL
ncbi:SusC/RagA family TonB-linked outer membrane protein [Parasediminibacterium sp. JCM 36343]|uniref:SusC/RagA family TonB-linked outer membrane protein n=1 Tax=Parasediminibacterium sp. JCM 36343 TaxID=3374279 RepID=UPI003978B12D